jgi:hypothetical protein
VIAMNSDTKQAIIEDIRSGGEGLTLTFDGDGKEVWRLWVSKRRLSPRTARYIINNVGVHSSDDALFPDAPAQTAK